MKGLRACVLVRVCVCGVDVVGWVYRALYREGESENGD